MEGSKPPQPPPAGHTFEPQTLISPGPLPKVTVSIGSPAVGATVLLGVPLRISGGATSATGTVTSVTVSVDGGAPANAVADVSDYSAWHLDFTFSTPGAHTISVTATDDVPVSGTASRGVSVIDDTPRLTITSPAPSGGVLTVRDSSFTLQAQALVTGANMAKVEYQLLAGGPFTGMIRPDPTQPLWQATVPLPQRSVPAAGTSYPLAVRGTNDQNVQATIAASVLAKDLTPPTVGFTPADGQQLPGTVSGVTVPVSIQVSDVPAIALTSGIASVTCQVDQGTPVPAVQTSGGDPTQWAATVQIPAHDAHTITVVARDVASNLTSVTHQVLVVLPTAFTDLSESTYLADLLQFASLRLLTGGGASTTITSAHLQEAFHQPFAAVASASAQAAQQPVHSLRLAVQALMDLLQPSRRAPIGRWPLDDGGPGSTVAQARDATGAGSTGVVNAVTTGSWVAGRPGTTAALAFNGSGTYVGMGDVAQLVVKTALTVAAWAQPRAAGWGVIAGKEGEYLLAQTAAGTIAWAVSNTTPGFVWVDTGVPLAAGAWSHVAVAYDGSAVRTYVNGVLRHTGAASGPIVLTTTPSELRIGSRALAGSPTYFSGTMGEVAVYDRALSPWDVAVLFGSPQDQDEVWVDDALPAAAQTAGDVDTWSWVGASPAPYHGTLCHQSAISPAEHQHFFFSPSLAYLVNRGDRLFTYVYLDPANPPSEVMLQWRDAYGSFEHRAYWGANQLPWGVDGTPSRWRTGALPPLGQWVRLEVPAALVGLEQAVVNGLAFTLYGGRATWDYSGKAGWVSALAASGATAAAYQALLLAIGTSYDELRLARAATWTVRSALAARLGFPLSTTQPDELNQLLRPLDSVADADLKALFGLQSPAEPVLSTPATPPLLQGWRTAGLRQAWRMEDWGLPGSTDSRLPVVDPDVVQLVDLAVASPGHPAYDLWRQRQQWAAGQVATLQAVRQGQPSDPAALQAVIAQVLGTLDLGALNSQLQGGYGIDAALAQASLTMAAFRRLVEVTALAGAGPLQASEWNDVYAILAQVQKVRGYPAWREAERALDLVLAPDAFVVAAPDAAVALTRWRADWTARLAWQSRLRGRSDQMAGLRSSLDAAIDAAEEARLPILRDTLVGVVGVASSGVDVGDWLTSTLSIDVKASARLKTTPLDQAVETLQAALFAIRTGLLQPAPPAGLPASAAASWTLYLRPSPPAPAPGYIEASFDQEWQWMGSYATWRAAMATFFFPENVLSPSLLVDAAGSSPAPAPTSSFKSFLSRVSASGVASPQAAEAQAQQYVSDLTAELKWTTSPLPAGTLNETLPESALTAFANAQAPLFPSGTYIAVPNWLREAFFEVPLQLALSLQRSGLYLAALEWLRTVYAYQRPAAGRAIYRGFSLDQTGPAGVQRPIEWLINDLNPHAVAASRAYAHVRFTILTIARCLLDYADARFSLDTSESRPQARALYLQALDVLGAPELSVPAGTVLPPNPLRDSLRGRAAANLAKLRLGLDIAGMPRPAGSTGEDVGVPPPSPYRYSTLLARAQQLLASASEVEARYLAALEKQDAEAYNLLKAGQDVQLSAAHVSLQQAQADIAGAEVRLTQAQRDRVKIQQDTYSSWIAAGPNQYEQDMLQKYSDEQQYRDWATALQGAQSALTGALSAGAEGNAAGVFGSLIFGAATTALNVQANDAAMSAQVNSFQASAERRTDEWRLQLSLANADYDIGNQQVGIASARWGVARQETQVAQLQQDHAEATLNFLGTKFTNVHLYEWMGEVLGGVYRHQLQRATAIAQLAQQQLAFERQERPPSYVKPDYVTGGAAQGLTGTARLQEDLTQLDQYGFETNQRKLQLTQTFSLAQLAPVDFQRFRGSGVLPFTTPMALFDRCFPGHYLRLLRQVKVSVVALVPPGQGIRASLVSGGVSRVVANGSGFRTLTLFRPPETVALTSATGATGLFEMDVQPELMLPFEGTGVDTSWELRLPRAANAFDFRSLADVLVTFEYTALTSPDYAAQVIRRLPRRTSNTLSFSLRGDFPDAWYGLLAQAQAGPPASTPLTAQVSLGPTDFPPNLAGLAIEQVALMVLRQGTAPQSFTVALGRDPTQPPSLSASTVGDVVSTRSGSGGAWQPLIGAAPTGAWALALVNDSAGATAAALGAGAIDDVVLVLAYGGDLPSWPA